MSKNVTPEPGRIFDLAGAAKEVGLTPFRVRTAIRKGDLKTHLEPVKDGSKTMKHIITEADLLAWRSATSSHTRRADGRNKYNMYMTAAEFEKVTALIADAKLETPIVRANVHKAVEAVEAEPA
jgi:hypothetical protein